MIGFGDGSPQLSDSALLVVNPKGLVVEQKASVSPIDQLTKTRQYSSNVWNAPFVYSPAEIDGAQQPSLTLSRPELLL